eukprot:11092627-Heterocapsa_arctica.AAC.1
MKALRRAMPNECCFDGCMYDVKGDHQKLVYKPWRVVTNSVRLVNHLSRRCDRSHPHRVTHGAAAVQSGYYSDLMVKIIDEAITERGE